jgi:hypothetical protein
MNTRRGASLIELLVILSASTVVLTLTGVLLHRAMRIQTLSRAHVDAERTTLRLSEQFRSDVHQARALSSQPGNDGEVFLRLELADGRVAEYSRTNGAVLRSESGGDRPTWREEYAIPGAGALRIEQESAPQRLVMTIILKPAERPVPNGQAPAGTRFVPMSLCAEAVVGRDLRFATQPASREAQK